VSEARNAGLALVTTDLVVFLDADDELLPGAIRRGVKALASDRDAAAAVGRCQAIDAAGRSLPAVHSPVDSSSDLYVQWLSRNFVWTPGAALFRRDALEQIGGFPAGLGPAADYAVYLRLARTGRVRFIADEQVRYRQHQSSMSQDPALMLRATLAVLRRERHEATAHLRGAIALGRMNWCEWYGEQIVDRLRADWRRGRRGRVQMRAAATLGLHCPRVALRHLARKTMQLIAVKRRQVC